MRREAGKTSEREPRWRGKARSKIALPIAAGDSVDCQRDGVESRRLAAIDHLVREAAILVHVQLKQLWRADRGPDVLHADRAKRRDAEHRSQLVRGARNGPLSDRKSVV